MEDTEQQSNPALILLDESIKVQVMENSITHNRAENFST